MDVQAPAAPSSPPSSAQTGTCANFDIARMQSSRLARALSSWLLNYPQREYWMGLLRRFFPIIHTPLFGGLIVVFRDEDVREVLAHSREFPVPWGGRMMAVTGKKNFVLGMADGPEYRRNYEQLAQAFRRDDVDSYVVPQAAQAAADFLRGRHRIDAVRDLIWRVPSQLCESYYGIEIPDKLRFAEWTVAMSKYLFGSPSESLDTPGQELALDAADCFRNLIRSAIEKTRDGQPCGVVLPRLIGMQRSDPQNLPDDVIVAHLFGMVMGFIPTDLLAGGNMLETLLQRDDFMKQARAAALADDDDLLWRCLQETLRFRHINPGPLRICGPDGYTLAAGTRRARYVAPGTGVLASTQSAMFDRRQVTQPRSFNPHRANEDYLVFGYGQHWCIGAFIAIAQITQTFKALLRKPGLRRARGGAGKLQTITAYPAHLTVEFDE